MWYLLQQPLKRAISLHEPKAQIQIKPFSLNKLNRITQQEVFKLEHIEKFQSLTMREM